MKVYFKQILSVFVLLIFNYALYSNPQIIKVGVFDYYPALFKNEKGNIDGYFLEAFKEIERRQNIKFEYIYGTFNENINRLQKEEIDILPNITITRAFDTVFIFSEEPLTSIWGEVYVSSNSRISNFNDLNHKKIGCVKHDKNIDFFLEFIPKFNINCELVYFNSYDEIFKAIQNKNIDAGIVNNIFGTIKKHHYSVRPTDIISNPYDIYIIGTQKNFKILNIIDGYLKKWKHDENSIYYKARQKWIYENIKNTQYFPNWLIILIIILIGVSFISIIIITVFRKKVKTTAKQIIEKQDLIALNETKFKTYLDNSPIGIFVVNENGNYITVNQAACDLTGYSEEELLAMNMIQLQPAETLEEDLQAFASLEKNGSIRRDLQIIRKDGSKIWGEVNAIKISDTEFLCFGANIETRKKNELQILEQASQIQKQNDELLIAKTQIEESDKLKTAFLQNISHEIRTPLNAIMGFSQILPDYIHDKDLIEKYCNIIFERGEDLLQMINDILHIAKIESGELTLFNTPISLLEFKTDIIKYYEENKKRLQKENISLTIDIDNKLLTKVIILDSEKLKQILCNLIHNSLKFTDIGGITITINEHANYLHIQISDTGIGISEENLHKIFERFSQIKNTKNNYSGSGLGLAIVKGLLVFMKGEISVTSEIHKGTTFTMLIPFKENSTIQ